MKKLQDFGPNSSEVFKLLTKLKRVNWLINVGKPHPRDSEVVRIYTWDAAETIARNGMLYRMDGVFRNKLKEIANSSNRMEIIQNVIDLEIKVNTRGDESYTKILWAISSDIEGAIYEAVLGDLGDFLFYLNRMEWYCDGHWPCGYTQEEKLVVF
jgi:helix-turn-helix protein